MRGSRNYAKIETRMTDKPRKRRETYLRKFQKQRARFELWPGKTDQQRLRILESGLWTLLFLTWFQFFRSIGDFLDGKNLWFIALLVVCFVCLAIGAIRVRKALELFEEAGPQSVDELPGAVEEKPVED